MCGVYLPPGEADGKKAEQQTRALYDILSCVRDVRKRSDRTDAMFEPLKETAALLHAFGIQLGDGVLKQLENADLRWVLPVELHVCFGFKGGKPLHSSHAGLSACVFM